MRDDDLEAVPTVQVDNDHVRVTEWRFARGAATGCIVTSLTMSSFR